MPSPSQPTTRAEHSNWQSLEATRSEVLEFARQVTRDYQLDAADIETRRAEIQGEAASKMQEVSQLVKLGAFRDAMKLLDEVKDNKLGIIWRPQELSDNSKVVFRDARCQTLDVDVLSRDAGEKYAVQVLSEVAGAISLIDQTKAPESAKEFAKERLQFIAETVVAEGSIERLNSKTVKDFNSQIIHSLKSIGLDKKKAAKQLVFAKEMGNFQNEQHHLATIFTQEGGDQREHVVVEADVMLTKLSEQVKTDFVKIRDGKPGVTWFDKLPDYQKQLIKDAAPEVLSETKMMPTQLIKVLPGLRNTYHKTAIVMDADGSHEQIISSNFHGSTPASRASTRAEAQEITVDNIRHLQSYVNPNRALNFNMLNGEAPLPGASMARGAPSIENDLVKQVKRGVAEVPEASVTTSPINIWRFAGAGRDASAYKDMLGVIARGLATGDNPVLTEDQASYFTGSGSKRSIEGVVDTMELYDAKLATILKTMVECKELADTKITALSGAEHINFEMTTKMNAILGAASIEGGVLHAKLPKDLSSSLPESVDFCKSGKDRTGYVGVGTTHEAINLYLGVDPKSSEAERNFLRQAAAGQVQHLAEINAASRGCGTLKFDDGTQLKGWGKKYTSILAQDSARFNSDIHIASSHKSIATQFEKDFQEYHRTGLMPDYTRAPEDSEIESVEQEQETRVRPDIQPEGREQSTSMPQESPAFMQELYDDMVVKQKMHEEALDAFKAKMESATNAVDLKAAMDEYRPRLESFKKDVAKFDKQQKIFESAGGSLRSSVSATKSPESSGTNIEDLKRLFSKLKEKAKRSSGGSKRKTVVQRGAGREVEI